MARRRGFGGVERRVSAKGEVTYRTRYAMSDGTRYSRSLGTKMDAEAWRASLYPSTATVRHVAVPATFDELAVIIDNVPERLRLLIVLAAFVGLRQGELLELRRSDVDGVSGRINVTRKIDKDVLPGAAGACPKCGRVISSPKTASHRSCRGCKSTCSSTQPRDRRGRCSQETAPTT